MRLDLDGFADGPDLELCVGTHGGPGGEGYVGFDESSEALRGDFDFVIAGREVGGVVLTGAGGDDAFHVIGGLVDDTHRDTGDWGASGIGNDTGDVAALGLGESAGYR